MPKAFTPKVITANALLEGDAVWLTEDDRWSRDIADAELLTNEAHAELRLIEASARQSEIAGAYLADAKPGDAGPKPVHFREAFRTRGPSNYPHGKQTRA
ncbi:DUF2849 domain-containing protein [Loktanella sp. SALINAS62]|uniref:DUF2849 domain-containing protein n=1 Tax=Loktanella sp. SALINAS62 TaxID=2706124 RepID=UPI001B8D6E73|nr:DUF2849 domain-containing protein [Loktanella sp. SALINAS62]MBS1301580.1 DUF2849 domain-containing protein [Loktanella sp. SALINAS62]